MKKIILLLAALATMMGAFDASAQGKYGKDSADCIKYLSYYKEYFKQKNYAEATPNWRKAYKFCPPTANQTMLIDGATLVRQLINKNQKNTIYKEALVDTLMTLHDLRAQNYPKYKITALNNKALDMINYVKNDPKKLYEGCKAIISETGLKTKPQVFLFMLNSAVELYQAGNLDTESVINDYQGAMAYINDIEKENPSETISNIKTDIESVFISSKVASCENLISLFTPRYEANPEDLDLAKNIVKMMNSTEDCADNDLYLKAVNTVYKLEPSYNAAYGLFRLYAAKGDVESAIKYMDEAIAYPESDTATDAQYEYELAVFAFKNGKKAKAYEAALKAVELDSSLAGKAYFLCGNIWGANSCGGNEIESRANFWVAVDYMNKAKAADESLTEDANSYIRQYSVYYPQTADAFMYNFTDGQSYTVSCGGLRATTTVRTQK